MKLSVILAAHNLERELPRTIRSLSSLMQHGVRRQDYEVIVVDNGSTQLADLSEYEDHVQLRTITIPADDALPSPARALNAAVDAACGALIGVMIDGARLASPGLLAFAARADGLDERAVILHAGLSPRPERLANCLRRL